MKPAEWEFAGFTHGMVPVINPIFKGMEDREYEQKEWAIISGNTIMLLQREMKGLFRYNKKLKDMLQELQDYKSLNHNGSMEGADNGDSS